MNYNIHKIYKIVNNQNGGNNIIQTNIHNFVTNPKKSFNFYKLNYSTEEKNTIKKFKIIKDGTLDYYGTPDSMDINKIMDFFTKIGNNKINDSIIISNIIKKLCIEVCNGFSENKIACWLSIRVSLPNNRFTIPRWHMDGKFYNVNLRNVQSNDIQLKFITTLKGQGTLLANPTKKIKSKYWTITNGNSTDPKTEFKKRMDDRVIIDNLLQKFKIQSKNDEGVIFVCTANDRNNYMIRGLHSEPDIVEPRIFISILPGTEREIKELQDGRKKQEYNFFKKKLSFFKICNIKHI